MGKTRLAVSCLSGVKNGNGNWIGIGLGSPRVVHVVWLDVRITHSNLRATTSSGPGLRGCEVTSSRLVVR
jgi:hypothetical protein